MSVLDAGVASTPYITVGGTQVPLPPSARADLAYQTNLVPSNAGFANVFFKNDTGDYLILLSFTVIFAANGIAGSRTFYVAMYGFTGANAASQVWLMPAGVTLVANQSLEASYMAGLGSSYNATSTDAIGNVRVYAAAPIPPAVMLPGYNLVASGAGPSVDSIVSVGTILAIRVPSGPGPATVPAPPAFSAPALV